MARAKDETMFDYTADSRIRAVIERAHADRASYVAELVTRVFRRRA